MTHSTHADRATLPASIGRSELVIAGVTLIIHNLDNGERVIERDGMLDLLEAMGGADLPEADAALLRKAMEPGDGGRRG